MRPGTTEYALFKQFDTGLHAHIPLSSSYRLCGDQITFPVSIIFGEIDWMNPTGSRLIVKTNPFYESGQSNLILLPNAGHQLFMNNPEGFIELVTKDLLGQIKNVWQPANSSVKYVDNDGNEVVVEPPDELIPTRSLNQNLSNQTETNLQE